MANVTATRSRLLEILSDGGFHSGESLGAALGVSRMAVWKQLKALRESGMALDSVKGKGYRLPAGIEMLDRGLIDSRLEESVRRQLGPVDVCLEVDSTNTRLREQALNGAAQASVCLAEVQHAGRGTRGRTWVSPFAASLYLSLLWRTSSGAAALGGMSLATGVAVARALESAGVPGLGLKWPNDVVAGNKKLGGILIDIIGEASGPCAAVIGIGINMKMPDTAAGQIDRPWTDVDSLTAGAGVSRNRLAAALLNTLLPAMQSFERDGLEPFRAAWDELDALRGKDISLQLADRVVKGTAQGIDAGGALLVESGGVRQRFASGEATTGRLS